MFWDAKSKRYINTGSANTSIVQKRAYTHDLSIFPELIIIRYNFDDLERILLETTNTSLSSQKDQFQVLKEKNRYYLFRAKPGLVY